MFLKPRQKLGMPLGDVPLALFGQLDLAVEIGASEPRPALNLRTRWAKRNAGLDSCGAARRAINLGSPRMAVPLSGIVSPKAEDLFCLRLLPS